jgi:radical SAM protein with 4Fe4S-binding SPASM domain
LLRWGRQSLADNLVTVIVGGSSATLDMRRLLSGNDNRTSCVWSACDPYTTRAVQGIEGNGQRTNCGRTNKDGVDFVKSDEPGFERYIALYHTPQENFGCNGCRFFLVCKGYCPGTAVDGDWRNRTEHCALWKNLYETLETDLIAEEKCPVSRRPDRELLEAAMLRCWSAGYNPMLQTLLSFLESNADSEIVSGHPMRPMPSHSALDAARSRAAVKLSAQRRDPRATVSTSNFFQTSAMLSMRLPHTARAASLVQLTRLKSGSLKSRSCIRVLRSAAAHRQTRKLVSRQMSLG